MRKKNIVLSFKGAINEGIINSVVSLVETKLQLVEEPAKLQRKVFNILVECLQNLYHHNPKAKTSVSSENPVIVMIAKNASGYSIISGNLIDDTKIESFKCKLDEINNLSKEELRALYKNKLTDEGFSDLGGAGLGLIDMSRKSGEKLEYGFIPFNDKYAFFSLNVKINS